MSYKLRITARDARTIRIVGCRYDWATALERLVLREIEQADDDIPDEGVEVQIPEHRAWKLKEAFEQDSVGGHSMFPMLDPRSDLHDKLIKLMEEIV